MKVGGVGCTDCHVSSDKIVKPDNKICLKCHESGFDEMMDEWKKDVVNLKNELNTLINKAQGMDLNEEQKNALADAKKIYNQINPYNSIYVHNYDLVSSMLSEKKKKLKEFVK
jgi:hypothetical protein